MALECVMSLLRHYFEKNNFLWLWGRVELGRQNLCQKLKKNQPITKTQFTFVPVVVFMI